MKEAVMARKNRDKFNIQHGNSSQSGARGPSGRKQQRLDQEPSRGQSAAGGGGLGEIKDTLMSEASGIAETVSSEIKGATTAVRDAGSKVSDIASGVAGDAGSTLRRARRTAFNAVKANPIPIALTGVGLTWLTFNTFGGKQRSSSSVMSDATQKLASTTSDATQKLASTTSDAAQKLVSKASGATQKLVSEASGATQKLGHVVHDASGNALAIEHDVERWMGDKPLLMGAAMLAVGAVIGAALPTTLLENTWFGKGREQVAHKARELARDAVEKVETVAKQVTGDSFRQSSSRQSSASPI